MKDTSTSTAREIYEEKGFYLHPEPLFPGPLIKRARERADAVLRGEYDAGAQPWVQWQVGEPGKFQKIDQVHLCDRTLYLIATHKAIGKRAAELCGAEMIQVFATQLFVKPPGGGELGVFNWHHERSYWPCWEGEVLAVWIALDDIGPDSGPVVYVEGSHRWPTEQKLGDPFTTDFGAQEERLKQETQGGVWNKVPALMPRGGAAFHSADTLHGSGPNRSNAVRIGLGISLRTNRARIKEGVRDFDYASYLGNTLICPRIYEKTLTGSGSI